MNAKEYSAVGEVVDAWEVFAHSPTEASKLHFQCAMYQLIRIYKADTPPRKMQPCQECSGTGRIDSLHSPSSMCVSCHGTGKVRRKPLAIA